MSIQKDVEKYVQQTPSVRDCLKQGLVNYSALSRVIIEDLKLSKKDFDAVLVALRRLHHKTRAPSAEKKIIDILKRAKIDIRTDIVVFIIEKDIYYDYLLDMEKKIKKESEVWHVIEGVNTLTIVTREDFAEEVRKAFKNKIIRENENLAELVIRTSSAIENTPGVLAYLYSLLAENEINIYETMSTWTDTLFTIDEDDLDRAMKVLKFR